MDKLRGDRDFLRHQIEAIQNATVDAIFTLTSKGRLLSVNDAACVMFGYEKAELLEIKLTELMTSESAALEAKHLRLYDVSSVTRLPDGVRNVEGKRKNGEILPLRLNIRSVHTADQTYYTCVVHDLSGYKKSRDRIMDLHRQLSEHNESLESKVNERSLQLEKSINDLAAANKRLAREIKEREAIAISLQRREMQLERLLHKERELGELKSRFVSMASHEFRTPLTTMLSSVEIIEMAVTDGPPVLYKHTHRIREGIGYLRNVLEDFLQLGKLDVKGTDLLIQEFDLQEFFERMTEDLNLMCKPGQDIELEIDDEIQSTNHSINGLRICITNLLTNAIKYSDQGSAIDIEVCKQGDYLVVEVKDEGIGIPKRDLKFLFERFFRASNAETEKGTGLGLHIVARYVEAMNGTIKVESAPGEGTVFILKVPYVLSGSTIEIN
ncbi:MAG: ATP-binding protein [Saprospiraceae bacterium]